MTVVTDHQQDIQLKTRDQALVLIGTLLDKRQMEKLLTYLPEDRQTELAPWTRTLSEMPGRKRVEFILDRLRQLLDHSFFEQLEEIHPTWTAHVLGAEPPLLAGLVLKSLPAHYARQVQKSLPAKTARALEAGGSLPAPPVVIQELFTEILSRRFRLINRLSGTGDDPFEVLFFLNGEELLILMEDLGTSELAMACQQLPDKDFTYICSKLPNRIRDKIKIKLQQYETIPGDRITRARQSFLHLQDELYEKGQLIEFTAIQILARALRGTSRERVNFLACKLPYKLGTILQQVVSRGPEGVTDDDIPEIRREIVEKIIYLAEIDRIRSLWKHFWRGNA